MADVTTLDTADPPAKVKFPQLWEAREALRVKKAAIEKRTTRLRAKRDELLASIQPTLDDIRTLEKQYRGIEQAEGLAAIDNQISALSKAMGGKALSVPAEG